MKISLGCCRVKVSGVLLPGGGAVELSTPALTPLTRTSSLWVGGASVQVQQVLTPLCSPDISTAQHGTAPPLDTAAHYDGSPLSYLLLPPTPLFSLSAPPTGPPSLPPPPSSYPPGLLLLDPLLLLFPTPPHPPYLLLNPLLLFLLLCLHILFFASLLFSLPRLLSPSLCSFLPSPPVTRPAHSSSSPCSPSRPPLAVYPVNGWDADVL